MPHVTVAADAGRRIYTAGVSQTVFSVPFPFYLTSDLLVYVNGVLQPSSAYTVTGTAVDGGFQSGTVTFGAAPATGATVTISRATAIQRATDFPYPSQTLDIRSLNTELDRMTMVQQESDTKRNLVVRISEAEETIGVLPLKADRANRNLGFDANGNPVAVVPTSGSLTVTPYALSILSAADANAARAALVVPDAFGFRNLLINANPLINQRGYVSGTATSTANQYTLDRWRVVVSGQSLTWSDTNNFRTMTAPAGGVEQVVEGASIYGGATYTLSWVGTATATVGGATVANGGQIVLVGGVDVAVRFSNGTVLRPQLEPGTVATSFERRPRQIELDLCQRYFQTFRSHQFGRNEVAAPGIYQMGIVFPVTMRGTPNVVFAAGISTTGITARTLANITPGGCAVQVTTANGPINYGDTGDYQADAEL